MVNIEPVTSRVFGLDLMRAAAIVLVVISHADDLLQPYWPYDPGVADLDGVDVFFVLSGYLIGNILLRLCEADRIPWRYRLLDFWQRRWLRTLPNYYLFLLLNVVLVSSGLAPGVVNENAWAYVAFLQNIVVPLDLFFGESWSLAVEEWFYVLFPVLLAPWFLRPGWWRPGFVLTTIAFIVIPPVLRWYAMDAVDTPAVLDLHIRKMVFLRLDTIGFGMLMAWLMNHGPALFARRRPELFALGSFVLCTAILLRDDDQLLYEGTWFFTFNAIGLALMLPLFAAWSQAGSWGLPLTHLARISYALYLVHLPLREQLLRFVPAGSATSALVLYVTYWLVCIGSAGLVHRWWERPFMALRDQLSSRVPE